MFIKKLLIGSMVFMFGSVVANAELTRVNGVITDSSTGLQWQDEFGDIPGVLYWEEAISYCESLTLNGQDDWRLPNINELSSITDFAYYEPAIDPMFTTPDYTSMYWSSTTDIFDDVRAWAVGAGSGGEYSEYKTTTGNYRCVRAGE